jgi:hypothetical protein
MYRDRSTLPVVVIENSGKPTGFVNGTPAFRPKSRETFWPKAALPITPNKANSKTILLTRAIQ